MTRSSNVVLNVVFCFRNTASGTYKIAAHWVFVIRRLYSNLARLVALKQPGAHRAEASFSILSYGGWGMKAGLFFDLGIKIILTSVTKLGIILV